MGHVNVSISGRKFRMACEDGQESHLTELAAELDLRIGKLRESHGEIGERLMVMAALSLADELGEMGDRLRQVEAELADLKGDRTGTADRIKAMQAALSTALIGAAERIEGMARRLNQTRSDNGGVAMG